MFVTLRTVQIIFVVGSLLPLISPSIPYGRTLQILVHMDSLAYRWCQALLLEARIWL